MSKYQANPVIVDAFKIAHVGDPLSPEHASGITGAAGSRLLRVGEPPVFMTATPEMLARMTPKVGDYWVVQSDGYTYLNPAAVFERKYSPVTPLGPNFMLLSFGCGVMKIHLQQSDFDLSPEVFAQRHLASAVAPLLNMHRDGPKQD